MYVISWTCWHNLYSNLFFIIIRWWYLWSVWIDIWFTQNHI